MKNYTVLTLFPQLITNYTNTSILKNAQTNQHVQIKVVDIRDYATNNYKQVDDYQYGGGSGMVIMPQPVMSALKQVDYQNKHVILLSPRGESFNQQKAQELANYDQEIVLLCGHYEGFDERINAYVDEYLSVGDYVLTSGELAALVVLDAVIRLVPEVIDPGSLVSESFNDDLLDHPIYTRPAVFENQTVPEVLLSGNHAKIAEYRQKERVQLTKKYRPDLYRRYLKKLDKFTS